MKHHALYRKWRPQIFGDIIGQEHITKTLINAINLNRISHAYIFSGPRGVGKTTTARILAKSLNCINGPTVSPCNKCDHCIKITDGYSMDVIEIDGASNRGIDDIRDLRNKVKFVPTEGNYKVYIIDEVHMLTTEAFNALLKTLEEPPSHVVFVFATTAPHKIPETILSRCQWFNFRRIPLPKIIDKLRVISKDENLDIDEKALNVIAKTATGSMRDAESYLEQIIAYCGKQISKKDVTDILGIIDEDVFFNIIDEISKNRALQAIEIIHKICDSGGDPSQFIKNLTEYIHNLSLVKICDYQAVEMKGGLNIESRKLLNQSKLIEMDKLFNMVNDLTEMEKKMRYSFHPWMLLEMFILKFASNGANKKIDKNTLHKKENLNKTEIKLKKESSKPLSRKEISFSNDIKSKASEKNIIERDTNIDLIKIWPKILSKIKKTRISLYSFIAFNNLLNIENNRVVIGFNEEHIFHKEILEKKINKSLLQELIREETGITYEIECIICANNKNLSVNENEGENTDALGTESEIKKTVTKSKNEMNGKIDDYEEDAMLQESLNIFKGKMLEN